MQLSPVETLGVGDLLALQEERFGAQWEHVRRRSSFYRCRLGGLADRPLSLAGLADVEPTTKDDLLAEQAGDPPFGRYLACPAEDVVRVHRTSGLTGRGMTLAFTASDAAVIATVGARAMIAAGLRPSDRVVHCLNYRLWTGGVTDHAILEAAGAAVVPYGVGDAAGLVQVIRDLGVTAISCTPSYPALLERVLREGTALEPRDLGLRIALFGGEAGLDNAAFRSGLEERWGFAVRNANYGLSEVLSILASQCETTDDLHFHASDVIFAEILDPVTHQRVAIEEGASGELVCTHLVRAAQPLLRYGCRDIVRVTGTGPCGCGRSAWRFRVVGRTDDMFNVRGVNVFPTAVRAVVDEHGSLLSGQFRIELHGPGPYDRIVLRAEAAHALVETRFAEAAATVGGALKRSIGAAAELTVVPYGTIERTAHKTSWIERHP